MRTVQKKGELEEMKNGTEIMQGNFGMEEYQTGTKNTTSFSSDIDILDT